MIHFNQAGALEAPRSGGEQRTRRTLCQATDTWFVPCPRLIQEPELTQGKPLGLDFFVNYTGVRACHLRDETQSTAPSPKQPASLLTVAIQVVPVIEITGSFHDTGGHVST